ncbi:MAG TPA: DNA-formamidopyrimidine glycosylase family protein [Acidimicrobiia bacterium]|nr:DNA-formamidopyrimidine glycosylase family protein [Acidimicrobiia bacterium]
MRPVLVGSRIESVDGSSPAVRRRSGQMIGAEITDIRTAGKHLLIDLDSGLSIHIHLGMTGAVRVCAAGARPAGRGGLRLSLSTERGTVEVMSAPTVEVDRRSVLARGLKHLGPDLLAAEFDQDRFELLASRFAGERTVSDFLLDQRVMTGIGNVYKSEVLFLESTRPGRLMATIDRDSRLALAQRARRLMQPNARRPGRSTTGRPGGELWVYGRAERPCRRCRTAIVEGWIGDPPRITYWCPACQPETPRGA